MSIVSVFFTPDTPDDASFFVGGGTGSVFYDGEPDMLRLGGRLITSDGFYIADANGTRIIVGGITEDAEPDIAMTSWTPGTGII